MFIKILFWASLVLVAYTYLGYYILLFILSKVHKKERQLDMNYTPAVTMIISAYNEEKVIGEKINNCLQLDYPEDKLKILIGSDGSDDATNQILKNFKNDIIHPFLFEKRRGKACVLNELADNATGEILVFSDANTIYDAGAIRNMVKYFIDPEIGGVCGRLELTSPDENIGGKGETLYWNYENRIKLLEGKIKTVFGANGAIYAIRRTLYQKLPEHIVIMDDFLIPLRIVEKNYDVYYEKDAVGKESASFNIKDEFRRKVRIGAANFYSLKEIWPLLSPTKGFVAFGLWSHKLIRWFVPFLLLTIFISNMFLLSTTVYNLLFIIQVIFYIGSFMGYVVSILINKRFKYILYGYYFISMNLALFFGFFKFIFNTQKPTWAKAKR